MYLEYLVGGEHKKVMCVALLYHDTYIHVRTYSSTFKVNCEDVISVEVKCLSA